MFVFQYVGYRFKENLIKTFCHIFTGFIAIYLLYRLLGTPDTSIAILNEKALANLLFIGILAAIPILFYKKDVIRSTYLSCFHLFLLIFVYRELSYLSNGQGLVSAVWGVYAIAVIVLGLRKNNNHIRIAGLATLGLVIGKLFIVDLKHLDALWKVLLFLGLGGIILVISYYFKALWKTPAPLEESSDDKIDSE
jgi:uncharacterized membrane protein